MKVRTDLAAAHDSSLAHVVAPGPFLDGAQRRRIAAAAMAAYLDPAPPPPWRNPYADSELALSWRLARHASTITGPWIRSLGLDPLVVVEVVGIVVAVVPVVAFRRGIGAPMPVLGLPVSGSPTRRVAAPLVFEPQLNWVPVAAPADETAAVVQALSALPDEFDNLWRLAAAQYMSDRQMDDPAWTRGTLSRPQMELVAGRLSKLRECFY